MKEIRCLLWARVSTEEQENENQLHKLREWAAERGFTVVGEYVTEDSAWTQRLRGGKGREFDAKRADLLARARHADADYILGWALDRFSRRGAEDMLNYVRRLTETGIILASWRDPWLEDMKDPIVRDILISVFASIARSRSEQNSLNIKLGIERRRRDLAAGRTVKGKQSIGGRKAGSKNRNDRPDKGQPSGMSQERRDALAQRNRDRASASQADAA